MDYESTPQPTQKAVDTPTTQMGVLSDLTVAPKSASNIPYLVTVLVMFLIGASLAAVIAFIRPTTDILIIFAAVFGFLTPTTAAILAFQKAQETHLSVNSRLDGFIKNAQAAALAAGREQGAQEANIRTDAIQAGRIPPVILPTIPPVKIDVINGPN